MSQLNPLEFDRLVRKVEQLQRANADLKKFAQMAARDLGEPLRSIGGFIQLVDRRDGSTMSREGRHFMHLAANEVRQMEQALDSLLAFCQIDGAEQNRRIFDANEALGEVCLNLSSRIRAAGASVNYGNLPPIEGDRGEIKLLFRALIDNSLKFASEAAPVIRIDAEPAEGRLLRFKLTDNGIGIAPADRERVFSLFERLHERENYEGSGIGLALCRRIVERHSGRIEIQPNGAGSGLCVSFTLPGNGPSPPRLRKVLAEPIELEPEAKITESVGRIEFVKPMEVSGRGLKMAEDADEEPEGRSKPAPEATLGEKPGSFRHRARKRPVLRALKALRRIRRKKPRKKRWTWKLVP